MKRTNFYFPDELLDRVRAHAEATCTTSSDVIRTAIEQYLAINDGTVSGPGIGQARAMAAFMVNVRKMQLAAVDLIEKAQIMSGHPPEPPKRKSRP